MWRSKAFLYVLYLQSTLLPFLLSAANGAGEAQGIAGRTPPQSAARTKSRQAKTPTQMGEFMHALCIHFYLFLPSLFVIFAHFSVPQLVR